MKVLDPPPPSIAAAYAQTDRMRAQFHRLNQGLRWMADAHHCRHDGPGPCLACYARNLLKQPEPEAATAGTLPLPGFNTPTGGEQ